MRMASRPLAICVLHVHSTYSDGTGTVPEIAAAAERAGVDVVLLTDHDSLEARRRGEEGWHGSALVCVGEEVSPRGGNHFLAFGLDEVVRWRGLDGPGIVDAVSSGGGFGFLAHPFSKGTGLLRRERPGMPWARPRVRATTPGLELWSLVTDTLESMSSTRTALRFIAAPDSVLENPAEGALARWDALTARRRVVAVGGIDAHQVGWRVGGRVPVRLMGYHRSFRYLRTHVLLDEPFTGDGDADRDRVYAALRAGHCYLARDSLAPARGFSFRAGELEMGDEAPYADGMELAISAPRPCLLRLMHDGHEVAASQSTGFTHAVEGPGVYRAEAHLDVRGRPAHLGAVEPDLPALKSSIEGVIRGSLGAIVGGHDRRGPD